ncbi:MAG: DNA replication/repair protein RecF [Bacteroidales bacterium]|nr:DNA replication/repair protein RecF [Bacteroidales bacterium]
MHLENLKLTNFKNYADLDVDFCPNINCFVGNNGVGKTNLLDAIYYLSFCKSFFNPIDTQNIRIGQEFFAIHGRYATFDAAQNGQQATVSCIQKRNTSKQIRWNKAACKSISEHIGRIPLVMVSPADQSIITGGSEIRRKFIDGVLSQTNTEYLKNLLTYIRILDQRNHLLKKFFDNRYFDEKEISLWDEQLAHYGEQLLTARKNFLNEFAPLFIYYYKMIAGDSESPSIKYAPTTDDDTPLLPQITLNHQRDATALYTTIGPHRDDLILYIGQFNAKKFASQGQQKTFVLSLKLAQFEYIKQLCGTAPILLLDDIFDKLDMQRVKQLLLLVGSDHFGQVFITDTQPGRVEAIFGEAPHLQHLIFSVENNTLN